MDVSGQFRDYGFYTVRPASIATAATNGSTLLPVLVGTGEVAALAGLAMRLGTGGVGG